MTNGFGSGGFSSQDQGNSGSTSGGFGSGGFGFGGFGSNNSGFGSGSWGNEPATDNSGAAGDAGSNAGGFGTGSWQTNDSADTASQSNAGGFGSGGAGGFGNNGSDFGSADAPTDFNSAPSGPLTFKSGPWHWVSAATATAVIGVALGIVAYVLASSAGSFTSTLFKSLAIAGWSVGGIVTFILLGLHIVEDTKRQVSGPYIANSTQVLLYRASAIVGFMAVIITAIEIALAFAK